MEEEEEAVESGGREQANEVIDFILGPVPSLGLLL